MFFLLLSISCSSAIALFFKITEQRKLNRYAITLVNYLAASTIISYFFIKDYPQITSQLNIRILLFLCTLGIITGFLFYYSFILYQKNINLYGASITGMFVKLGILLPMIISIIFWNEYPNALQFIAIVGSLLSIILVNLNNNKTTKVEWKISLILLFFVGGTAEFTNKIFQKYFLLKYKPLFLIIVFFSAFLFSWSKFKKENLNFIGGELKFGIIIGFFNLFSSFFLIESLNYLKTSIAFALFSSLSMSCILICSYFFFNESLKKKDITAVIITIISLFIINFN